MSKYVPLILTHSSVFDKSFKYIYLNQAHLQQSMIYHTNTLFVRMERETEMELKEPWDKADVDPDTAELKIPSPWPHYFRIYIHRLFSLIFLVVSSFCSSFQYVSFAMVCYLINPLSMNPKANLNCNILGRSLNSTRNGIIYADYDEYEAFLNETQPQYEIPGAHDGEIILLRKVLIGQ